MTATRAKPRPRPPSPVLAEAALETGREHGLRHPTFELTLFKFPTTNAAPGQEPISDSNCAPQLAWPASSDSNAGSTCTSNHAFHMEILWRAGRRRGTARVAWLTRSRGWWPAHGGRGRQASGSRVLFLSARRFVVRFVAVQMRIRRIARTIMGLSFHLIRKGSLYVSESHA